MGPGRREEEAPASEWVLGARAAHAAPSRRASSRPATASSVDRRVDDRVAPRAARARAVAARHNDTIARAYCDPEPARRRRRVGSFRPAGHNAAGSPRRARCFRPPPDPRQDQRDRRTFATASPPRRPSRSETGSTRRRASPSADRLRGVDPARRRSRMTRAVFGYVEPYPSARVPRRRSRGDRGCGSGPANAPGLRRRRRGQAYGSAASG